MSGRRSCPRDHTTLLPVPVNSGRGATVDECPDCGGVYLDKNELVRLTGDRRLNTALRDEVGLDSDSSLLCPGCGGIMDEEHVFVRTTEEEDPTALPLDGGRVVVDVCLTCFGLWLDRGEFEMLRARRNRDPVERPAGKAEELATAGLAQRRVQVGQARGQGRGVGGAVRRRFLWLDDTLDEVVRRWL